MKLKKLTDTCYMTTNDEFIIAEEESGEYWMVMTVGAKLIPDDDAEQGVVEWLHSADNMEACVKWLNENITEH